MAKQKRNPRRRRQLNLVEGYRLGKYRLDKRLGEGGSCEVWRALDTVEDIVVGSRVGIGYAEPQHQSAEWRLAIAGSPWVSHARAMREAEL